MEPWDEEWNDDEDEAIYVVTIVTSTSKFQWIFTKPATNRSTIKIKT